MSIWYFSFSFLVRINVQFSIHFPAGRQIIQLQKMYFFLSFMSFHKCWINSNEMLSIFIEKWINFPPIPQNLRMSKQMRQIGFFYMIPLFLFYLQIRVSLAEFLIRDEMGWDYKTSGMVYVVSGRIDFPNRPTHFVEMIRGGFKGSRLSFWRTETKDLGKDKLSMCFAMRNLNKSFFLINLYFNF